MKQFTLRGNQQGLVRTKQNQPFRVNCRYSQDSRKHRIELKNEFQNDRTVVVCVHLYIFILYILHMALQQQQSWSTLLYISNLYNLQLVTQIEVLILTGWRKSDGDF